LHHSFREEDFSLYNWSIRNKNNTSMFLLNQNEMRIYLKSTF